MTKTELETLVTPPADPGLAAAWTDFAKEVSDRRYERTIAEIWALQANWEWFKRGWMAGMKNAGYS